MIADFSCRVPHMKFGDFRNGRTTGLGQKRTLVSCTLRFIQLRRTRLVAVSRANRQEIGESMKFIFGLVCTALLCANAQAQMRKCVAPNGKVTYSDVPCTQGSSAGSIANPGGNTLDNSGFREQAQKENVDTDIANSRARNSAAQTQARASLQSRDGEDARAVSNCVRDVERQSASQNVKAELIAACRTAGLVQRSTGISGDAVKDCVTNVERTGASGRNKARQLAICHGGDVDPEPRLPPPSTLTSCDRGGCWDDRGNRYTGIGKTLFRSDGKTCQKIGNMLHCN